MSLDRILVDVVSVMKKILVVTNPMIGEASSPDFASAANQISEGMGIAAFDQLHRVFQRYVVRRSKQQVHMFRHDDERVDLKSSFATISIKGLKKESNVVLDYEQSPSLPCRECYKVGSGRRDEPSWLQERTSAAKAAVFG